MSTLCINENDHILGNKETNVSLIIYEDYECEYCGKAFKEIKMLYENFKEKVCIAFRNYPHTRIHPSSFSAALITEAAALQNKFIQIHDFILGQQEYMEYGINGILKILEMNYGISVKKLKEDMTKAKLKKKIHDDFKSGLENGVKNTPAIFINGVMYKGAVKFNQLAKIIRQAILSYNSSSENLMHL